MRDETRKIINPKINETMDKIISAYEKCFYIKWR